MNAHRNLLTTPGTWRLTCAAIVVIGWVALPTSAANAAESAYRVDWIRQLGTDNYDHSYGVSADRRGNIYIAGITHGALGGEYLFSGDAFVSKYDHLGSLKWIRQLGSPDNYTEIGLGISSDGLGNVFVAGSTDGTISKPPAPFLDALLLNYDTSGGMTWALQFGGNFFTKSSAVSADGLGNAYTTGMSDNLFGVPEPGANESSRPTVFVSKVNSAGSAVWTRQFGSEGPDEGLAVAADALGNVYVAGYTSGTLNGPNAGGSPTSDVFLARYTAAGNRLWIRQFGTSAKEEGLAVATDSSGNVFVAGRTSGSLGGPNAGLFDAFVRKYNAAGNPLWTRQFGTSADDVSYGIAVDELGNAYLAGYTDGSLGAPNIGLSDVFVTKFNAAGSHLWTQQIGTNSSDISRGISTNGLDSIYISGYTAGSWDGPNAGAYDAFLVHLVPEPNSMMLATWGLLAAPLLLMRRGPCWRPQTR